jgi:hypothetical protein
MTSTNELITTLESLGLHFVTGGEQREATPVSPSVLIAGLAEQTDARLHMALTALLLYLPHFADEVSAALISLSPVAGQRLKIFYTAAVFLQQTYQEALEQVGLSGQTLPDLFSAELGIPPEIPPHEALRRLGEYHRRKTGLAANWVGMYHHSAKRLITRLRKEAAWAI